MFDRNIGRRKGGDRFRIVSIYALPREYGRHAIPPKAFDCRQNSRLVVNKNVMFGGKTALNVVERFFLVDIDEHTSINRVGQTRPFDFVWLKDDVAIGKDNGRAEPAKPLQDREHGWKQPVRQTDSR